jgi:hypothetical protein
MNRLFNTTQSNFLNRNDQLVKVIRPLTADECNIDDVGKMYKIRFSDGYEMSASVDDLKRDYSSQFYGYHVPEGLKQIVICILRRFSINGLCDGMYICNTIASLSNIGNGAGVFSGDTVSDPVETARRLQMSYKCNIQTTDIPELAEIIQTRNLNIKKAIAGLNKYIKQCINEKKLTSDNWRSDYLTRSVRLAEDTIRELKIESSSN